MLKLLLMTFGGFVMAASLWNQEITDIEGKTTSLESYKGKVLLIVNTASKCGYTPQYEGLQTLQGQYFEKGFTVLGFPSNDFGGQEPGSNAEIKKFCKLNYNVNFPLFAKAPVSGAQKQPLYKQLLAESSDHSEVKWNFEKFLVNRQGKVVGRFSSKVAPNSKEMTEAIENALK